MASVDENFRFEKRRQIELVQIDTARKQQRPANLGACAVPA